MVRPPCCDKLSVKRGLWTAEEDAKILAYVSKHGTGNWTAVPKKAGLRRCGKSCRLRWTNYLRPDLKHESFTPQEEEMIVRLHAAIGSRWSIIAQQLPGRTDNDVKNYWNTKLRKKLTEMGIDPVTHKPFSQILADYGNINGAFPKSRIGSLNRDLKNYAFLVKSSDNHFFNSQNISNNPMDLLAQLQAINFVTQPSNNYFESNNDNTQQPPPQPQPHILSEEAGCSFSSNSSSTSSTCNSSADHNLFSWRDFLLEDAFVDDAQQQQQQKQEREININLLSVRDEEEEVQQLDNGSFVETMLDQDNKMMLEFPQLLHEPFYY